MAIAAGHRDVASRQREPRVFVASQSEGGRQKSLHTVAAFTNIEIGLRRELAGMLVAVAVGALREFQLVNGIFAPWNMAPGALQRGMLALQWVCGCRVLFEAELCRFESLHRVAGRARASIWPLGELSVMRVGVVAIRALAEGQGFLEITAHVALHATHLCMFAE